MFSIISFGNVRMSGMKSPVMSYSALGVGLAIMLTVGLTAIAGVVEQPLMEAQMPEEQAAMKAAPTPEMAQRQADVSSEAGIAATPATPLAEEPATKQEQYFMTPEPPISPFAGLSVAIPYMAAAIVGSVVFVVARKRVGL